MIKSNKVYQGDGSLREHQDKVYSSPKSDAQDEVNVSATACQFPADAVAQDNEDDLAKQLMERNRAFHAAKPYDPQPNWAEGDVHDGPADKPETYES